MGFDPLPLGPRPHVSHAVPAGELPRWRPVSNAELERIQKWLSFQLIVSDEE